MVIYRQLQRNKTLAGGVIQQKLLVILTVVIKLGGCINYSILTIQ
ncbi:MAG: hypothetical protein ACTS8U_01770 [Arsenophonus sp. ET-DL9-MAG3]